MHRLDFRFEGLTEERLRRGRHRRGGGLAAMALGFLVATVLLRAGPGGNGESGTTTPTVSAENSILTASASPTALPPSTTPPPATLTATATVPLPTETETPTPPGILAFEPARADFGIRPVSGSPVVQTLGLTNGGVAALHIGDVSVDGSASEDFAVHSGECTGRALAAGEACAVEITFIARAPGNRSAFLIVADDTPSSPHRVRLSGTGAVASAALQPTALDFGEQLIKTSSSVRSVTLRNTGPTELKPVIRLQGDAAGQYSLNADDCARRPLESNGRCRVELQFRPSGEGRHTVALNVADDSGTHLASVPVTGTAPKAIAIVRLDPGSLDFTNTPAHAIAVRNEGTSTLNITAVNLGGQDQNAFRIDATACLQAPLLRGGSCSIQVRFTPPLFSIRATRTAEVVIVDNAADSPQRISIRWSRHTAPPTQQTPGIGDLLTPNVPSLLGLTVEQAKQRLEERGLRLGSVHQEPSDTRPGIVFRQNPEAEQRVIILTRVDVWVSAISD